MMSWNPVTFWLQWSSVWFLENKWLNNEKKKWCMLLTRGLMTNSLHSIMVQWTLFIVWYQLYICTLTCVVMAPSRYKFKCWSLFWISTCINGWNLDCWTIFKNNHYKHNYFELNYGQSLWQKICIAIILHRIYVCEYQFYE